MLSGKLGKVEGEQMKPLNWAFRKKSVKEALCALDELQANFETKLMSSLAFAEIKAEARSRLIDNPEEVSKTIETEGVPPRIACLMLLVKITRNDLASGRDPIAAC